MRYLDRFAVWLMTPNQRVSFWCSLFLTPWCWATAALMFVYGSGWIAWAQLVLAIVFTLSLIAGIAQKQWRRADDAPKKPLSRLEEIAERRPHLGDTCRELDRDLTPDERAEVFAKLRASGWKPEQGIADLAWIICCQEVIAKRYA